jgi:hypothetical protein
MAAKTARATRDDASFEDSVEEIERLHVIISARMLSICSLVS